MSEAKVTIQGLAEFRQKMAELPMQLQKKHLREFMRDAMKTVRDSARAAAPRLEKAVTKNGVPTRLPGTLRRAISVRSSKQEAQQGNVGVFVNVRPLKGNTYRRAGSFVNPQGNRQPRYLLVKKSQRSAENPRDPYYWRWIEFGTKQRRTKSGANRGSGPRYEFLQKASKSLASAVDVFERNLQAWIQKANQSGRIE